ncbi:uncharacterized protein A4U43_C05F6120 [Asparagus officinalis]|uniref:Domain X domain-containing protein n=1 Tax=Asparagus officinalis TaxID=4686 RepID=A0A5P1ESA1_ASPOF|nr:uncharacterized protein LOC109843813 [Asparagus officinalis]ONK67997.1 uncharacterized protein A4U43_C05F6120 [Asparagus officinalis]
MWSFLNRQGIIKFAAYLFGPSTLRTGKCFRVSRSYMSSFLPEELENNNESKSTTTMSLAKSLACLPDEALVPNKHRDRTRVEMKRLIELRIKKRVKSQYSNGKFYNLMEKVIAKADTLQDSYDIIRLNSNVELEMHRDEICFNSMAQQLASGGFDVQGNVLEIGVKCGMRESLILPRLKLRVIQEAIRVVLEIIYRPHFSKISHGCRSGRGHRSALNSICKELQKSDWWFTLHPNKEIDDSVLSKLILLMEEKLKDDQLTGFVRRMFDAKVLNLVFGDFPKGHGLPQEGALSPILMNIYLDSFDCQVFQMSMRYESLGPESGANKDSTSSKLRNWVRRQIKHNNVQSEYFEAVRIYVCRFMDEIFVSVSGSKDVALNIKLEMVNYLKNSLYLDVENREDISKVRDNLRGVQFLGSVLRVIRKENDAVRAVHKLKDKVRLFASQKREIWDSLNVRIGRKWLAHGLRRIKESEIKALNLSTPQLDHISQFRKDGMKTDHWFKSLIKIWMQDVKADGEANEEVVLSKYIAEPSLPQDLRESFYNFQNQVENYVSTETASTLALLPAEIETETMVTRREAPISYITKSLHRYGLVTIEGYPRYISALILKDDNLIISWYSGLVYRWLKWYNEFDNFEDIKLLIVECVRKSCIKTLAAKFRIHESLIERKFESEISEIPMTQDIETNVTGKDEEDEDEGLMYGISHSGLCLLTLSRVRVPMRMNCFVMGCNVESPSMYIIHVKERQRFPGWSTGFSSSIHPSLNARRIGICNQHVKDLYLGHISLQSIEFGVLSR